MQLSEIFTQNGYTVKAKLSLNDIDAKVMAIGTNEVLWIGGVGYSASQIENAICKLNKVFSDTLDDTHIDIKGFIITGPNAKPVESKDILSFKTIEDFETYMAAHKNPAPTGQEKETFNAYSDYIDSVMILTETA